MKIIGVSSLSHYGEPLELIVSLDKWEIEKIAGVNVPPNTLKAGNEIKVSDRYSRLISFEKQVEDLKKAKGILLSAAQLCEVAEPVFEVPGTISGGVEVEE